LEASVYLALSGFVKQAVQTNRSWVELTLMGIWFRNKERDFSKWLMGEAEAHFSFQGIARKNLLQAMFKESPFLARCDAKNSISD